MSTTQVGKSGEDLASNFLQKQGYKIIERNFRIRGGEIDIIAIDGDALVFVEVKTRSSHRFGLPQESINYYKIKFLQRAAKFYRRNRQDKIKLPNLERIDVVTVDYTKEQPIDLFKNVAF